MSERPTIAALFGANLNMLGRRNPVHYGSLTLSEVLAHLHEEAERVHVELLHFQANSEGELVDWVHAHRDQVNGYIVNPGGFTMFGQAFCDAIVDTDCPYIEVHWSNIHRRGIKSLWSESAVGQICGFHFRSGTAALRVLAEILRSEDGQSSGRP